MISNFVIRIAAVLWTALAVPIVATSAQTADPVFPIGSLVGLVPPPGMAVSKTFPGFVDLQKDSAILLAAQPAAAYGEIQKTLTPEALKKEGIDLEKREQIQLSLGQGTLVTGAITDDKKRYRKWLLLAATGELTALANAQVPDHETAYSDAVIRAALTTLALRQTVPDTEKLSLLPFTVGDLAGFRVDNVIPGRALMLTDTPNASSSNSFAVRLFVGAFSGGPTEADDPGRFARLTFDQIVGITDVRLTMSEPLRLAGRTGYQTMGQAKDARTGADIMVVQWLRFGGGAFLQIIGMAPSDGWTDALTRLRTVRDSIEPR